MMSVPRLSSRAEIPMTAIMIAAASPTTTILRWVVRFAVYSDQFMSLTKSALSPMDYCISGQRTYTKVQVPQFCPILPWRKSVSGQHDVRFESKADNSQMQSLSPPYPKLGPFESAGRRSAKCQKRVH